MRYAAMDIGGTFIKYACMDGEGVFLCAGQVPIDSNGSQEDILSAIDAAFAHLRAAGTRVDRTAVSIPGPFDYAKGVSLMTHKFASIYQFNLKSFLESYGAPAVFLHDSTAFMLGEFFDGAARGARRPFGVMLGTGFGFAMMRDDKVCVAADQRPCLKLCYAPYRQGIVEDVISRRALRAKYALLAGSDGSHDVREIAMLARGGDPAAGAVMEDLGQDIAAVLEPYVRRLECDKVVVGGQIARSGDLFLPIVQEKLNIPVLAAKHLDDAALRGAVYAASRREMPARVYPEGAFD